MARTATASAVPMLDHMVTSLGSRCTTLADAERGNQQASAWAVDNPGTCGQPCCAHTFATDLRPVVFSCATILLN
ncbi:hypothetical protein JOF56_000144 [Kibdelosporangium banguiense]|uniref:Uncharacterized protein n=1 Tax=Kibdelosporangium banguiense TaxID=1365924 RepID=A0ABS4T5L8_9PSEU|nr:hypothetical protein [Kibdelosporangium banguiense]